MRVLLVHNYYGSSAPSGENQVFEAERTMLQRHGVTVDVFTRHSDEIRGTKVKEEGEGGQWTCRFLSRAQKLYGLIKGAVCTVANPFAAWALKKKIREFKPDVVHFHNTFPLISPLAILAAKRSGAKVVMTLHNYRMVCAAGIPMRGGKVCRECFAISEQSNNRTIRTILPAIRHRCYRGSLLATMPLALNIWLYRKCWAKWVDKFIVLSEFQRQIMIECGLPAEKVMVKGNFVTGMGCGPRSSSCSSGQETASPLSCHRSGVVFVGRMSDEKGVKTLLKAWQIFEQSEQSNNRTILTLIGDGDQRAEYESLAKGLSVRFLGKLSHEQVLEELAKARLMVMPSEWWETFGLVVVEAAMYGTPSVVSDLGALPGIVGKLGVGRVFKSGDADGLAVKIRDVMDGQSSLQEFKVDEFGEERNFKKLNEIYSA